MKPSPIPIIGIDNAIAELGYPDTVWYRGHSAAHRLIPTLWRFFNETENASQIVEQPEMNASVSSNNRLLDYFSRLIRLHHSYSPTRLLEWTENLYVALFCAMVRESGQPAVYVLDPVALNTISNIAGVICLDALTENDSDGIGGLSETCLPVHPIAIDNHPVAQKGVRNDSIYTLHGTNFQPLEDQCPSCVRQVLITEEERSLVIKGLLSGQWI